ncbi:helix-turn-helix domain-containing protein [Sphingomonas xanthus]|uniref:helix-turn-helix domain-containing protein n=1 Tax=Sphingomonas xanthus TaxID=2594473 RepID=UPI00164D0FC7|nr:helix-turn-helix domain-containing protein [Sphingomonas xanthus]
MTKRYNTRLLHSYRLYTIPQLAKLLRVGKNTISRWISLGLVPVDRKRPYLFKGWVIAEFLLALNPPRCPLRPGELFCTPCRKPRRPSGGVVTLEPKTPTSANFKGTCPDCKRRLFRRVRYAEIPQKLGDLIIRYEDENAPVSSSANRPCVEYSEEGVGTIFDDDGGGDPCPSCPQPQSVGEGTIG